jgi:hypothetical protein
MKFDFLEHSINIKMLILMGLLYYIFISSTIRSCCTSNNLEGMTNNTTKPKSVSLPSASTLPKPILPPSSVQSGSGSGSGSKKEGFVGANTNYGESSSYSLENSYAVDTSKWGMPNLTISGGNASSAAQAIINRPNQSFPLPEGQLSMFDNMPFSPECCPNAFSSSMGCACMNSNTYNYLITRGGNNVPFSEY